MGFAFTRFHLFFSYNLDYRSGWGWLQRVTNLTQTDLDKLSLVYTTAKNNNKKKVSGNYSMWTLPTEREKEF